MADDNLDVAALPSAQEIENRVNDRYDALFHHDPQGNRLPFVCCVCDEFLTHPEDICYVTVAMMRKMEKILSWENFPDSRRAVEIEQFFRFPEIYNSIVKEDLSFLARMALSPRGIISRVGKRGKNMFKFCVCKRCKGCVDKQKIPRHAIINCNYIGAAPPCLQELTEVELAFLSPVKGYGFCFTWVGGKQRNLKGTLTFMRVEKRSIGNAVVQLEEMGFNDHVLVLFSGGMTSYQKKKAEEKTTIRTQKIFTALEWLCKYNVRWSKVDLNKIRESLSRKRPVVHDRSHEVESENTNIECQEVFTCYYPDGAATPTNGGFEEPQSFKEYVTSMAQKGFDVEFEADLQKSFVTDGDSEVIVDACLLQYPYGIGHMYERRKLQDGSWTTKSDLIEYLQHVSKLSQSQFQNNFFQLVLYSLGCKFWLLKTSRLSLRGKTDAENLATNLNAGDVISCINGRRLTNRRGGTNASRALLDAVDATARSLPHTNEASRKARGLGESMMHHFGMSSVFITVTFDDENSFLMQIMSGSTIDDDTPVDELTDQEVCNRAEGRRELRIKFPGLATLNFEILLEILMSEVIGWDMRNNCPNGKQGYCGYPEALNSGFEEQGRRTVHVHMSVWIRGYNRLKETMFFGLDREKVKARRELQKFSEHISTTQLFPTQWGALNKSFDHDCKEPISTRKPPEVVPAQSLRNLRNRKGYKDSKGLFAFCTHCDKTWTYEQMVNDYIRKGEQICGPNALIGSIDNAEQIPKARMMAKIVEFQRSPNIKSPRACINATYQHHVSCHVTNCFRCQKKGSKKRGHVCGPECECRYRMPDMKRARSELMTEKNEVKWFLYDGTYRMQPLMQVCPKRGKYDLFQNVSCTPISYSKFTCNNNIACVIDGPIGYYIHKYQHKENQKEEVADYAEVAAEVKKFAGDRKHEEDRPEALRRICRAAFAHNKTNITSASMASFLLRRESRFYFSHQFQFCPLQDLVRLHNKQEIKGNLKYKPSGECFFENHALHYLCRNKELESETLRSFVEGFEVCTIGKKMNECFPFEADTGYYKHPSILKSGKRKGQCSQGVRDREDPVLIRVSQWMFPDTATFKENIFECNESAMNQHMEQYAQLVLTLFYPHRHVGDLQAPNAGRFPYLFKLRDVYQREKQARNFGEEVVVFTEKNTTFLQNLQNARSNSLRYKMSGDPLADITVPYESPNPQDDDGLDDGDDNEEDEIEETAYEIFAKELQQEHSIRPSTDEDPEFLNDTLRNFDFGKMKDKGRDNCGNENDVTVETIVEEVLDFVETDHANTVPNPQDTTNEQPSGTRAKYSVKDIVNLHLKRNEPKTSKTIWEDKTVDVSSATGSIKSIREWSKACFGSDKKQQRAFEVLISAFLLTFYDEKAEDKFDVESENPHYRSKYRRAQRALRKMRGAKKDVNLVALLHGAGGSGKSTVINTVKAYAKDYCRMLGHKFTNRTIIVTAMSGVAATLLGGETTHSVLGLNRDSVQNEEALEWADARLLIIDEVSFASDSDFEKMHEHLKLFMRDHFHDYGGLNVVFAGDYSQLEPVGRDPIYKDGNYCPEFHGALNCYIELDGKWRFRKDPRWGDIMARFREGCPTYEDIDLINSECLTSKKTPPVGIQVASYTNKDRDAINASIYDSWTTRNKPEDGSVLKAACLVFMDELYMNDGSKTAVPITSNMVKRHFYENCTESECNFGSNGRGRVDPVLKLYPDAPMMLTRNTDVARGEANGSRVRCKKIVMKGGEKPFELLLDNGTTIFAVYASQLKHITLEHENADISPRRFNIESDNFTFKCRMMVGDEELYAGMKGRQFPIISNSCTTGHKLQGCTVDSILANDWYYGANWVYVVLSRVRTMKGLYIRKPLSKDLKKYEKPAAMKEMLKKFQDTIAVEMFSDEEYDEMCKHITDSDALLFGNSFSQQSEPLMPF